MMKGRVRIFLAIALSAFMAFGVFGCGKSNPTAPSSTDQDPPIPREVYLGVTSSGAVNAMTKTSVDGAPTEVYVITIGLSAGDGVTVYDNFGNAYSNYDPADFNGTVAVSGNYTFELRISAATNTIYVTAPTPPTTPTTPTDPTTPTTPTTPTNPTTPITPTNPTTPTAPTTPASTKTTVYYTDSNGWGNVYAYLWNYGTGASKAAWPGQRLNAVGTSGFNEKQYAIEVDYSQYDRVIFNDGGGNQTEDLVVGAATSGYYGTDGIFTMGANDYGTVRYTTLTDTKNLAYLPGSRKKISVFTPSGYTPTKKYGVLYMFDSQNLYAAASGAEGASDQSQKWAVDVTVSNLIKNGGDGVIIVAIDNTDGHRDQELTMSLSFGTLTHLGDPQYGSFRDGKLDELGDFMKETLMPWVKSNYSVDGSREKTGIAGSSSGGLAAYYLGLRDNGLYGYIGAFSPANGLFASVDWTRFYGRKNGFADGKPSVYVYCGQNDGDLEDMLLPEAKRIKSALAQYGIAVTENYVDKATHNERFWRIAFTDFLGKTSA